MAHPACHRAKPAGDAATLDDVCDGAGNCGGKNPCGNIVCQPLSDCHDVGTCTDGICSHPLKDDGTPCSDGNAATTDDVCQAGTCTGTGEWRLGHRHRPAL